MRLKKSRTVGKRSDRLLYLPSGAMAEGLDDTQEQELEELLRFNETLMRENELFESHLQRTAPALLADDDEKGKRKGAAKDLGHGAELFAMDDGDELNGDEQTDDLSPQDLINLIMGGKQYSPGRELRGAGGSVALRM